MPWSTLLNQKHYLSELFPNVNTYSEATKITLPMQNSERKPALSRRKHDEAASTHTCTAVIHRVSQLHVKNATKIGTSFKRREACDPGNT